MGKDALSSTFLSFFLQKGVMQSRRDSIENKIQNKKSIVFGRDGKQAGRHKCCTLNKTPTYPHTQALFTCKQNPPSNLPLRCRWVFLKSGAAPFWLLFRGPLALCCSGWCFGVLVGLLLLTFAGFFGTQPPILLQFDETP